MTSICGSSVLLVEVGHDLTYRSNRTHGGTLLLLFKVKLPSGLTCESCQALLAAKLYRDSLLLITIIYLSSYSDTFIIIVARHGVEPWCERTFIRLVHAQSALRVPEHGC